MPKSRMPNWTEGGTGLNGEFLKTELNKMLKTRMPTAEIFIAELD
jgi:hypothetical protein